MQGTLVRDGKLSTSTAFNAFLIFSFTNWLLSKTLLLSWRLFNANIQFTYQSKTVNNYQQNHGLHIPRVPTVLNTKSAITDRRIMKTNDYAMQQEMLSHLTQNLPYGQPLQFSCPNPTCKYVTAKSLKWLAEIAQWQFFLQSLKFWYYTMTRYVNTIILASPHTKESIQ